MQIGCGMEIDHIYCNLIKWDNSAILSVVTRRAGPW